MNKIFFSHDLAVKISNGDSRAFKEFYETFCDTVYHFSCFFLKSEVIREEVVSDVFISVWNTKERLPDIHNIEAYLYIITRNTSYNYIEKEAGIEELQSPLPFELMVEYTDPEKILRTKELEIVLNSCIDKLSTKCRIIFLLSRKQNLKYREIAQVLSISEKTVHAQMVIALRKLNESFKNYMNFSEKKLQKS